MFEILDGYKRHVLLLPVVARDNCDMIGAVTKRPTRR